MPSVARTIMMQRNMQQNPNLLPILLMSGFVIAYIFVFYLIGKNIKSGIIDNIGNQNKVKLLGEFLALFIAVCITSVKLFYRQKRGDDKNSEKYKNTDKKYYRLFLVNIAIFFGLCGICYFDKNIKNSLK